MRVASSPDDPEHLDEAATRLELARITDVCASCRLCIELCGVFPAMFRLVDAIGTGGAALMTPNQQDEVFSMCHGCGLCTAGCPHGPERHPDNVDVHAASDRWWAMRRANGLAGPRERLRRARSRRAAPRSVHRPSR